MIDYFNSFVFPSSRNVPVTRHEVFRNLAMPFESVLMFFARVVFSSQTAPNRELKLIDSQYHFSKGFQGLMWRAGVEWTSPEKVSEYGWTKIGSPTTMTGEIKELAWKRIVESGATSLNANKWIQKYSCCRSRCTTWGKILIMVTCDRGLCSFHTTVCRCQRVLVLHKPFFIHCCWTFMSLRTGPRVLLRGWECSDVPSRYLTILWGSFVRRSTLAGEKSFRDVC